VAPRDGTGISVPLSLELLSSSPDETRELAARLAAVARPGDLVALFGELGAGKTEFAKGFARGLGVVDLVDSPSFVLMAEYRGRMPLFHLDLFRLRGPLDAVEGGLVDERRAEGVTLVEWAERLEGMLPAEHVAVHLEGSGDEPRRIELRASMTGYRRYIEAAGGGTP
jgi:tRNA threonylcarbamoyladenosine biosynthesis protein TsaE